jgi:hypothetical protein
MGKRRRDSSIFEELMDQTIDTASSISWKGSALLGIFLFNVFFWLPSIMLTHTLESMKHNQFYPLAEVLAGYAILFFQGFAIVLAIICFFYMLKDLIFGSRRT